MNCILQIVLMNEKKIHYNLQEFSNELFYEESSFRIIKDKKRGNSVNAAIDATSIFLLRKGELLLTFSRIDQKLTKGQIVLIPPGFKLNMKVLKSIHLVVCRLESNLQLYQNFGLDYLLSVSEEADDKLYPLSMNEYFDKYLSSLEDYISSDLPFIFFSELKKKELLLLLQVNYTNEELSGFFLPVLSKDISFKETVLKEYLNVDTVKELAEKLNYSLSGFKKKFEQSFGQTAYSWIQEQKANDVFKELTENRKTIKEIVFQYKFSSQPRFYEFCKRHYGKTPKEIQKQLTIDN